MLKKTAASVLALTMAFAMAFDVAPKGVVEILPCAADSSVDANEPLTYGDFQYSIWTDGTIMLDRYNGRDTHVELPGEIDGKPVTYIGFSLFEKCVDLESVTIPKEVTTIGVSAFRQCTSLTSINIPEGVVDIMHNAFDGCTSLASVTIPKSVTTIGEDAFRDTPWLAEKISESPMVIENDILIEARTCEGDVVIPDGVVSISPRSFYNCGKLTSVKIPDSVTYIGGEAFRNCKSLTSIDIPDSVEKIGSGVFSYCEGLTSVKLSKGLTGIEALVFDHCESLTSITIPDSVTYISTSAFYGCENLTSIIMPDTIWDIGQEAFERTSWLESKRKEDPLVIVNDALIDAKACEGAVDIPSNVKYISPGAFYGSAVTSVTIPDSITFTEQYTFQDCESLTSAILPDTLERIGFCSFQECTSLESIIIPDSVKDIGAWAFVGCTSMKSITIPASVKQLGDCSFGYDPMMRKLEDFHIYCYEGTAGHRYAIDNGFDYTLIKLGDINGDNKVDSADVVKLAAYVKGLDTLTTEEQARANVNGDSRIDSADVVKLAAQVKGLSPTI